MASTDRPAVIDLAYRGLFGSVVAITGFGGLMLATRLDKVGEAAALRETSIIFATAIGVLFFREKIDAMRVFLIFGIATGAILIEFA
jgi:drug/metabolite transporter (DMT)-like permease